MKRLVVAWAATALAATGAAVAVIGLLGNGLTGTDSRVLTEAEIRSALATATAPSSALPSAEPSRTPRGKLISSAGGHVIASCEGDAVRLHQWSPAQDYSVDEVRPGPGHEARVQFERDDGEDGEEEVELRIVCSDGVPVTRDH